MKIQDIFFCVIILIMLWKRDPKLFAVAGIASLVVAIPLFWLWIFFTAERFVWYGASFLLLSILFNIYYARKG